MVKTKILPGMSHGFFQVFSLNSEAKQAVQLSVEWIEEMFKEDIQNEDSDLKNIVVSQIDEISEKSVLKRRLSSMASRLGLHQQ